MFVNKYCIVLCLSSQNTIYCIATIFINRQMSWT